MAYVVATPDLMTAAAADLENIASTVEAAHLGTAPATIAVAPAAADEVSTSIAHLFSEHAQGYYAAARAAAASQDQFVQNLTASAAAYTGAEDAIIAFLQGVNPYVNYATGALLYLGLGYLMWAQPWVEQFPLQFQTFLYFPVIFFLLDAFFLYAFWAAIAGGIVQNIG